MENQEFNNRIDVYGIQQVTDRIKDEIGKVIVGQDEIIEMILVGLLSDGHILLEGVPGVAKTLMSKLLAQTISVDFTRIQFTPDLMPSDVIGTNIYNQKDNEFEFKKGPIFSNIVLIDEINRAPAKTQAALFEVMEEKTITVDSKSYKLGFPFMIIATQNPIEHEGTYRLPEAQLDRFAFKLIVGYPSATEETEMLRRHHSNQNIHRNLQNISSIISAEQLQDIREKVSQVRIDDKLLDFITQITQKTRNHGGIYIGSSPRASINLLKASKALATLRSRDFVIPDDIVMLAPHILRHRITLTPEKEMDGISTDDIVKEIIKDIEIPR